MILNILKGDITAPGNKSDIVIGMNSLLQDVTGIGLPFVKDRIPPSALQLGSVLTYDFDGDRRLHMIICHNLGVGGWADADKHVRFGLDYLEYVDRTDPYGEGRHSYSIVQIGKGRVGIRDGADHAAINRAMADSFLPLDLYVYDQDRATVEAGQNWKPLRPLRTWNQVTGERPILQAAA